MALRATQAAARGSGTALAAQYVDALARVTDLEGRKVVVAFDADEPGHRAALRAYPLLRAAGAVPEVATLPEGEDPSSLAYGRLSGS